MQDDLESGTHRIARGPSVLAVEQACNEIDLALAEAVLCLDFLAELTSGEPERAVGDAQAALQRIGAAVDDLRGRCANAVAQTHATLAKTGSR